jgi:hypothetical protein
VWLVQNNQHAMPQHVVGTLQRQVLTEVVALMLA